MHISFSRLFAAALLAVNAVLTGLVAFAIGVARAVVDAGYFPVRPADAAAVHLLASATPVVAVFAVASLVAAIALVLGTPWARRLAVAVSATGVAIGVVGLVLLLSAQGPFAVLPSNRALDGIEGIGTFAVLQLVALVASLLDRPSSRAVIAGPSPVA